jgi:hypothetical protein
MSKLTAFVQVHGRPGLLEIEVTEKTTLGEIHELLRAAGIEVDAETFVFIDDAEQHETGEHHHPVKGIKRGCRIHVTRCRRIKTTVHFAHKTAEHDFAPGVRVRAVKEWAVHKFEMAPTDAAEHVLQLCKSTERPTSDTPLQQLVHGHDCALCFDLVPEKRVEGQA